MTKKTTLLLICILSATLCFSQEKETVLEAPESWGSEIITFPMDFAPSIDFTGFEDIRFTPGWTDPYNRQFWTYSFVWYIDQIPPLTEQKLTDLMSTYYDGLMNTVLQSESESDEPSSFDNTLCLFIKSAEGFSGKARVYDAFFSKEYVTLHLQIKELSCPKTNKQIVRFNISPKPFQDDLWKIFDQVKLSIDCD